MICRKMINDNVVFMSSVNRQLPKKILISDNYYTTKNMSTEMVEGITVYHTPVALDAVRVMYLNIDLTNNSMLINVAKLSDNVSVYVHFFKEVDDTKAYFVKEIKLDETQVFNDITFTIMCTNDTIESYAKDGDAVVESLNQKLKVIRGEIWNHIDYGIPLLESGKSKGIIDAFVIQTVNSHPDVTEILEFNSQLNKDVYTLQIKVLTTYGEILLSK